MEGTAGVCRRFRHEGLSEEGLLNDLRPVSQWCDEWLPVSCLTSLNRSLSVRENPIIAGHV
ncbi:MAG TPA: hypothetical protein DD438_09525, partial [Verrucomicrobiales bacterium]|nr:hypothetical protein [Verrucomicrobiales bacterium]